jgi:hypothetical protein
MAWDVEFTDEFELWWNSLTADEQDSVAFGVGLLQAKGPTLARPYADTVYQSAYVNMKELRVQHEGRPYRVLFVFDPRRVGMLLIGGDKTGKPDWYEEYVPKADKIYAQHLQELEGEQAEDETGSQ